MDEAIIVAVGEFMNSEDAADKEIKMRNCASPLHYALQMQDDEMKRELIKRLIAAGVDCDIRDPKSGLTGCESALVELNDRSVARLMISAEIAKLTVERAFYVMIRRGSLEVFELFLDTGKFEDKQIFQNVSNALIELNVRRVPVNVQLEVYCQHFLANYAFLHLRDAGNKLSDPVDWRISMKIIEENWRVLCSRYDDRSYLNIDNEFLHRIEEIHNHMYFIKHKQFLRNLPLMEATFCLAIFVSIFKWESEYHIFRPIISKVNIMLFIKTICRQLQRVGQKLFELSQSLTEIITVNLNDKNPTKDRIRESWLSQNPAQNLGENVFNKIISGFKKKLTVESIVADVIDNETIELSCKISASERSVLRKLRQCYSRTKQLYSIQKCIYHINAISYYNEGIRNDTETVLAAKRLIQVLGEAVKSTKNSPNIPKKIDAILVRMLTNFFPKNSKFFREFFSHKYSLSKMILHDPTESSFFNSVVSNLQYVEVMFAILFICSLWEICRSFLGDMLRCKDHKHLRSMFQYCHNYRHLIIGQQQMFTKVNAMLNEMHTALTKVKASFAAEESHINFLKSNFLAKVSIIKQLEECSIAKLGCSIDSIKAACLAGTDVAVIHRMIRWNLSFANQNNLYREIMDNWKENHVQASMLNSHKDILIVNPSVLGGIMSIIERKVCTVEETEYTKYTCQILTDLNVVEPNEKLYLDLHRGFLKFYENVFFLDNKYKAIKQVFKQHKIKFNELLLKEKRIQDEQELQNLYDRMISDMQKLLEQSNINTTKDLIRNMNKVPSYIVMGLEYAQLELCEILITLGYFGDNFYLMKHRIPMIHGRNYRNYLAHDTLSYNILTSSTNIKTLLNALVLVNNPIKLFKPKKTNDDIPFTFPSAITLKKWVDQQTSLLKSFRDLNLELVKETIAKGSDLNGWFCDDVGKIQQLDTSMTIVDTIDPNYCSNQSSSDINSFIKLYFPKQSRKLMDPMYRTYYALQLAQFEEAFKIYSSNHPVRNTTLPQNFFYWELIIDYLLTEMSNWEETDNLGRTVLHRLVQAGNYDRVELLLDIMPEVNINQEDKAASSPLDNAFEIGCSKTAKLLLMKNATPSITCQQMAIIKHFNDLLPVLFQDHSKELEQTYLSTAVRADNLEALQFLVNVFELDNITKVKYLSECLSFAASLTTRKSILTFLINDSDINYFSEENLPNTYVTLRSLAKNKHRQFFEQLLARKTSNCTKLSPSRAGFNLAVEANRYQTIRILIPEIDQQFYLENVNIKHPQAIAITNGSWKMIRYLQRYGFTPLDNATTLHAAALQDQPNFLEWIFTELDKCWISEGSEGILNTIGILLKKWHTIAFLESVDHHNHTTLMQLIPVKKFDIAEKLMEISKNLRKFEDNYLQNFQQYENEQLVEHFSNEQPELNSKLIRVCKKILTVLKSCKQSERIESKFKLEVNGESRHTSVEIIIEQYASQEKMPSRAQPDFEQQISANHPEICQKVFESVLKYLKGKTGIFCGVIHGENLTFRSYFFIQNNQACLLNLSATQHLMPLKKIVNHGDFTGESALHFIATGKGNHDFMELLLKNGANPISKNSVQMTPLHLALISDDQEKALLLLHHCINNNLKTIEGSSALEVMNSQRFRPIHCAASTGKLEALELLLQQKVDVRSRAIYGVHAAMFAAGSVQLTAMNRLLEYDPSLVNLPDESGDTLLHFTAKRINSKTVELILNSNIDLFIHNNEGKSALQLAIESKNKPWLKTVLRYAKQNNITGLTETVNKLGVPTITFAVFYNDPELLAIILEYEIDGELGEHLEEHSIKKLQEVLKQTTENEGYTSLHVAVVLEMQKSVEFLLHWLRLYNQLAQQKLNLIHESLDFNGESPLDLAMKTGNDQIVRVLLESI